MVSGLDPQRRGTRSKFSASYDATQFREAAAMQSPRAKYIEAIQDLQQALQRATPSAAGWDRIERKIASPPLSLCLLSMEDTLACYVAMRNQQRKPAAKAGAATG